MSGPRRPVFRIVIQNFINSLRPRQIRGDKIGTDYLGNTYFEIPANRREGKRRASRWFEPPRGDDFESEMPAEWESWLRHRRPEPPSEEEIAKNVAVMNLKKENAARLEAERLADGGSLPTVPVRGSDSFPKYTEYEIGGKPVK